MPGRSRIEALAMRKRELVAQNELYRQALAAQFRDFQAATSPLANPRGITRAALRTLGFVAPLLGSFSPARRTFVKPLLSTTLLTWQLFRRLKPIWRRWRHRPDSKPSPAQPQPR